MTQAELPFGDNSGKRAREEGHEKHRVHLRPLHLRAQHAIINHALIHGTVSVENLDGVLPAAPSGSRSYIGTAFADLCRAKVISRVNLRQVTARGRHSHWLFNWRLTSPDKGRDWLAKHPLTAEEDSESA
jgi:hypothetical protein